MREVLERLGGQASLRLIYDEIDREYHATSRWRHWKAKVRQVLQKDPKIERVEYDVWRRVSPEPSFAANDPTTPKG